MASVLDTADLIDSEDQTSFNLAVWQKVLDDSSLTKVPHRIETERTNPPAPSFVPIFRRA
jgi:hypothetical protein